MEEDSNTSPVATSAFQAAQASHPPLIVQTANGTAGATFVRTIDPMSFVGDEIDKTLTSIVILIPGEMHVVGHVVRLFYLNLCWPVPSTLTSQNKRKDWKRWSRNYQN